jgi:hypothetical protein
MNANAAKGAARVVSGGVDLSTNSGVA